MIRVMADLLHDFLPAAAATAADRAAVVDREHSITYAELNQLVERAASGLTALGVRRGDRVAVLMPKRIEKVAALIAVLKAGAIAVPVNALLKAPQVAHILRDSGASALITAAARLPDLLAELGVLAALRAIVAVEDPASEPVGGLAVTPWSQLVANQGPIAGRPAPKDAAMIFYTSGSTGKPKGVVVTHRNIVIGARSVAEYLQCRPDDRVLAVLSFSFDYGFNQIATTLLAGATLVVQDYRLPQEVLLTIERERITALAGVPPIWIQLAGVEWPKTARSLRYVTNSGGAMPRATLNRLRTLLPETRFFLMYGLTEAFRSTYLPPEQVERRPDSIGRAIPNAEVLVLRPDGRPCAPREHGELVHRGPLVAQGYWKDPVRTARRFRLVPGQAPDTAEPEHEVWSGDTVWMDEEGFLYFVGREDDMIKTSGFRVSPTEVEEEAYASGLVRDAVALGAPHERLGQGVVLVVTPGDGFAADTDRLMDALKRRLPRFMLPLRIEWRDALPRNPNGKYDRSLLRGEFQLTFAGERD